MAFYNSPSIYAFSSSGFTLIELVVVLGIITLVIGISIASYGNFNSQEHLKTEANKLVSVIDLAVRKTTSSDISSVASCTDFIGYQINFTSPTTYSLEVCCNVTCSPATSVASYTLLDTSIGIVSDATVVHFNPFMKNTWRKGASLVDSYTIKLTSSTTNQCIEVTVYNTGLVSSTNPSNTCP